MPISELLMEGVTLMLLGMGIVFSFLTLLVFAMHLMSLFAKHLSEDDSLPVPLAAAANAPVVAGGEDELIAVITAAVKRFRASQ